MDEDGSQLARESASEQWIPRRPAVALGAPRGQSSPTARARSSKLLPSGGNPGTSDWGQLPPSPRHRHVVRYEGFVA